MAEDSVTDIGPEEEEEVEATEYAPPLDRLLTYGEGQLQAPENWPNYVRALGLGPEHIPDLIRMGTDPALNMRAPDDLAVWAPLHAWRALGQLRAEAAIEPLLPQLDNLDDDWAGENLPAVYGMIGPAAIPALVAYIDDRGRDFLARIRGVKAVEEIGQRHPESYEQVVDILLQRLKEPDETTQEAEINGFLVNSLTDLRSQRALPIILQAFDDEWLDESIIDRTSVLREFGLITPEEAERYWAEHRHERLQALGLGEAPLRLSAPREEEEEEEEGEDEEEYLPPLLTTPGSKPTADRAKAKAKRKMAQQSRKKNKKRK